MALADTLARSGIPYPIAVEIARQITLGGPVGGSATRMMSSGVPLWQALELSSQINAGVYSSSRLASAGWPSIIARTLEVNANTREDLMLISTKTASSSAALIWTGLDSTYDTLILDITGMIPSAGGGNLVLRVSEDNGQTFKSASYNYGGLTILDNTTTLPNATSATAASSFPISGPQTTAAGAAISTEVKIKGIASSSIYKSLEARGMSVSSGPHYNIHMFAGAYIGDTGVINAIEILQSSGQLVSGTASLYGLSR